jgi:hypothetical protein
VSMRLYLSYEQIWAVTANKVNYWRPEKFLVAQRNSALYWPQVIYGHRILFRSQQRRSCGTNLAHVPA